MREDHNPKDSDTLEIVAMSFKLKPNQSLRKGLARVMRKQIESAIKDLRESGGSSRDEIVHETRKTMKKVRPVLRLVRPKIGGGMYREANAAVRDTARPLTEVRDARILIDTLDKLADDFNERVGRRAFTSVRKSLESHARSTQTRVLNQQHVFTKIRGTLRELRQSAKEWADVPNKWSSIGAGLTDTYRRAGQAFTEAAADPQPEKLHEWRKQAKYLRYQLELLEPAWPDRMKEVAHEADAMGGILGDDRDLTLLRQMLCDGDEHLAVSADVELLLALIEHRQKQLRDEAILLGKRSFTEQPADVGGRIKSYWQIWRNTNELAESATA